MVGGQAVGCVETGLTGWHVIGLVEAELCCCVLCQEMK